MKAKKSFTVAGIVAGAVLLLLTAFSGVDALPPDDGESIVNTSEQDMPETAADSVMSPLTATRAVAANHVEENASGEMPEDGMEEGATVPESETAPAPESTEGEESLPEDAGTEEAPPESTGAGESGPETTGAQESLPESVGEEESQGDGETAAESVSAETQEGSVPEETSAEAQPAAEEGTEPESASLEAVDYFENQFIVTVEGKTALNVREEPTTDSKWVGKMYTGSGGYILETGDGWTKIKSGKVTGWVSNDYILTGESGKAKTEELCELVFEVESDALKVRSAPTTEEENKLRAIYGGESYTVKSVQDGWVEIEYSEGKTGWVVSEYGSIHYSYEDAMSRKAIEEAEAAKKRVKVGKSQRGATDASVDDLTLLACLIQCESGSYEGQLAVANVILNRVNSSKYPNSISGVIYAAGQFSPVKSGKLAARLAKGPSDTALQAASDALAGVNNIGNYMHFRSERSANIDSYSSYTIVAGNCFYK
ncbi:MAG: SH3 domain-containing protein [Lachnospiraceae bacterium]|jgi:uncharacterized protein YgiM (DUF1202 family)|nr:SH3 domain-containing protein [Lachnospiraceae bacterium]